MPCHLIPPECTTSGVGDTARPSPHVCFPTCKRQDCPDSRDSLGIVLSKTAETVSHSAPFTVTCTEQLANSRTAETLDETATSTCFRLTTLALTPTDILLPPPPALRWHVKKHRHWPSCKFLPQQQHYEQTNGCGRLTVRKHNAFVWWRRHNK